MSKYREQIKVKPIRNKAINIKVTQELYDKVREIATLNDHTLAHTAERALKEHCKKVLGK